MNIRHATPADLPAMRAMEAQAATAAHWTEEQYQRLFSGEPRRLALVIEDEPAVKGFLVAKPIGPEWEIENIIIAAPAQRRGLGAALLAHFLSILKQEKAQTVFLEVRASNAAARALYARQGFVEAGRRRNYYQHPAEDAVVYRKALSTR